MKQDYPLIKSSGGNEAIWKTIVDHPHVASLSGAVDTHLTEVKTVSGDVIYAGDLLVLNDNNTVGRILKSPDTTTTPEVHVPLLVYDAPIIIINDDIVVSTWQIDVDGSYAKAGKLVGDTVEWGSSVEWHDSPTKRHDVYLTYDPISEKVIFCNRDGSSPYGGYYSIGTLTTTGAPSGYSIEFGPLVDLNVGHTSLWRRSRFQYSEKYNKMIHLWATSDSYVETCTVVTTGAPSAAFIDFDSPTLVLGGFASYMHIKYDGYNDQEFIYPPTTSTYTTMTVSADVVSVGGFKGINVGGGDTVTFDWPSNNNKGIVCSRVGVTAQSSIITLTPDYITSSTQEIHTDFGSVSYQLLQWDSIHEKFIWWVNDNLNTIATKSATLYEDWVSWSERQIVISYINGGLLVSAPIYLPAQGRFLWSYKPSPTVANTLYYEVGLTNLTDDNFYGISQEVKSNGQDVLIGRFCYMDTNQSGMTINTNYYIDDYGGLTSRPTQPLVGKAVSDTEIIIKG